MPTLYKHCKNADGKWRYYRAVVGSNNKLKPHAVWVDGKAMLVPDWFGGTV